MDGVVAGAVGDVSVRPGRPRTQIGVCTAVPGCHAAQVARGWCWTHYKRWQAHGDPAAVPLRRPRGSLPPADYLVDLITRPMRIAEIARIAAENWGGPAPIHRSLGKRLAAMAGCAAPGAGLGGQITRVERGRDVYYQPKGWRLGLPDVEGSNIPAGKYSVENGFKVTRVKGARK